MQAMQGPINKEYLLPIRVCGTTPNPDFWWEQAQYTVLLVSFQKLRFDWHGMKWLESPWKCIFLWSVWCARVCFFICSVKFAGDNSTFWTEKRREYLIWLTCISCFWESIDMMCSHYLSCLKMIWIRVLDWIRNTFFGCCCYWAKNCVMKTRVGSVILDGGTRSDSRMDVLLGV